MAGDVFFAHASITPYFKELNIIVYLHLFPLVCPSILYMWVESNSSSHWQHLAKCLVIKQLFVKWPSKWMNGYMTVLFSALHWWAHSSHSLVSKVPPLILFLKVSLMENHLLLHTWQMSHTSVVMKFSSYSHFSVLDGRIHVKKFYFTPFRLL